MIEMLMNDALSNSTKKEEELKNLNVWIQASFIQAGVKPQQNQFETSLN